ncbi:MAG: PQQ-dependent sugar dehydrogenase [Rhodanobacteraceae bacterium]
MLRIPFLALAGLLLSLGIDAHAGIPADVQLVQFSNGSLSFPDAIRAPQDGSGRLFVPQQTGAVKILDADGTVIGTYLTVNVTAPSPDGGEQGLLGMAFDPNFGIDPGQPGYGDFYLAFTAPPGDPVLGASADQVVRRYSVDDPASNDASSAVQTDIIRLPDIASNHNGGDIHFGSDGYLYWGMGDGGSEGDPHNFSQTTGRTDVGGHSYYLLGKMIRIDVHHSTASATADMCAATLGMPAPYSIPPDNPFAGSSTDCGEIFLYGLRNPFRFSFDRATGDLWIGDVGQNAWEEEDLRTLGSTDSFNYGFKLCEGNHYYSPSGSGTDCPQTTGTTAPVIEYGHSSGCATTGGFRYRGPIASLQGTYVYSDSCSSTIWFATTDGSTWTSTVFPAGLPSGYGTVVSFGEDEAGNLYLVHETQGKVYEFTSTTPPMMFTVTPTAGPHGAIDPDTPQTVDEGATVDFTVTPDGGYRIADVTGCGGMLSGTIYTTAPITADCDVLATFSILTHTVTPVAGPNGNIMPATPQTVDDGATISFVVTPDTGYQIDDVSGCDGVLDRSTYTTGAITADCTVTATFAPAADDLIFASGFDGP